MQEIKIVIGKSGKIVLDVNGVKGSGCKDLTKKLEKALGSTESTRSKTEMYEQGQGVSKYQETGSGE
jgi:hypothetical protein